MKTLYRLMVVLLCLVSLPSFADTESNMTSFFDGMGFNTKVNTPTAYHAQGAYYYSVGSLSMKSKISNIQPVSVTLPSI